MKSKSNKDSTNEYGVRFTIPDAPPKKQLKMVNDLIDIMTTFAKIAGEEEQMDLIDAYAAKEKLEKQIKDKSNHNIGG